MASRFLERAEKEILRKVSMIVGEIRDPRLDAMYSLSRVSLAPDFSQVKCYFAVNGTEWKINEVIDALKKAAPFIRKRLGQSVRFKKVPKIQVYYDSQPDAVAEMDALFDKIRQESAAHNPEQVESGPEDVDVVNSAAASEDGRADTSEDSEPDTQD